MSRYPNVVACSFIWICAMDATTIFRSVANGVSDLKTIGAGQASTKRFFFTNTEIVTSLPLQMLLYFNLQYSLMFFIMECIVFKWKIDNFTGPHPAASSSTGSTSLLLTQDRILTIIFLFIFGMVEPFRLYLGYTGNLREKVPQLIAFVFLTLFPQIFPIGYFLIFQKNVPFDFAVNLLMLCFLVPEFFIGCWTTRKLLQSQSTKFYLQQWGERVDFQLPRNLDERQNMI